MFESFRWQLTTWYVLVLTLLLAGFSGFLYFLLSHNLYDRIDDSLRNTATTVSSVFEAELDEIKGDASVAAGEIVREMRLPGASVALFEGGRLLAAHEALRGRALPVNPGISSLGFGRPGARAIAQPLQWQGRRFTVVIVKPLDSVVSQLEGLRRVLFMGLPIALLIASLGGFWLATKSIAPVISISEQAEAITDRNLDTRLDVPGARVEFARLARVFNELFSRLGRSFATMREFVADASHELRTPLAVIRGEADVALAHNRQPAEYRESLAIIQDEARRLSRLVEDLLNLARADAGHSQLNVENMYLNDLVEECCRSAQTKARQGGVHLVSACGTDLAFRGDPELLRRLVANLLDNAIRYTPAGGQVEVKLEADATEARISVSDTGIGIPLESVDKIFDRFYRVDEARSRAGGGFGLGLAIVKWIAEAHRGHVEVASRLHQGSTFTVRLLLPPQAPAPRRAVSSAS